MHDEIRTNHSDLLKSIAIEKELSPANDEKLKDFLDSFVEKFLNS